MTWRLGVIVVSLLAITGVRALVDEPATLGLSLPSIGPIVLAAYWYGRKGAVVVAAAATALFILGELAAPSRYLAGSELLVATLTRGLVFFGTGVLVAELLRRERSAAVVIAEQNRELGELRVLREALTPSAVPPTAGLEVATAYVPAQGPAAGDFFLVVPGPTGTTLLAVGDAAGHDVLAARRASFVRAILATYATSSADPARLLELANTALLESEGRAGDFLTAVCASLDGGRLTWSSAGHPAPWDLDTGADLPGPVAVPPLGVGRDLRCSSTTVDLDRGGGILLFSDGLPEARPAGGELAGGRRRFGEDAARAELTAHAGAAPATVVHALREAATRFAHGALADDLCMLAARRT